MAQKVRVIINKHGHIPGIGNGPVLTPIYVLKSQYDLLKKLGYDIKVVKGNNLIGEVKAVIPPTNEVVEEVVVSNDNTPTIPVTEEGTDKVIETITPSNDDVVEVEETIEEVVEETEESEDEEVIVEETIEEVVEETEEVEIIEDDEELSAEAFYTMDFLTGAKAETILTNRGVDFSECKNATAKKELVLETNPEVEEA